MTVIAYRNGVMAADSSCWIGTSEVAKIKKIYRIKKGLAGVAGDLDCIARFVKWLRNGADEDEFPTGNFEAITVDPDLRVTLWEGSGYSPILVKGEYYSVGSGTDFALGAFFAGANAVCAVRAAIRHHSQCRGPVSVFNLNSHVQR